MKDTIIRITIYIIVAIAIFITMFYLIACAITILYVAVWVAIVGVIFIAGRIIYNRIKSSNNKTKCNGN